MKKAFDRLTKLLDVQEEIIQQSEECIEELYVKIDQSTKGEQWKISREIRKHQKIIAAAEARIEDEEDKEEIIRRETKVLLELYKISPSIQVSSSKTSLPSQSNRERKENSVVSEESTNRVYEEKLENLLEVDVNMNNDQPSTELEYNYKMDDNYIVVKTAGISESKDKADGYIVKQHGKNDEGDIWTSLKPSSGYASHQPCPDDSDWHLTKEVIYPAQSAEVHSFPEDEWSKLFDAEPENNEGDNSENSLRSPVAWNRRGNKSSNASTDWTNINDDFVQRYFLSSTL